MKQIIHWAPRVLAVWLAGMLALFIGEGFDPAYGWQSGAGHALLAAIAGGLAWLGWTKPRIGGLAYLGIAAAFIVAILFQGTPRGLLNPVFILPFVIGVLFIVDGRQAEA